jgi:hypothetical protein
MRGRGGKGREGEIFNYLYVWFKRGEGRDFNCECVWFTRGGEGRTKLNYLFILINL